MILRRVIQHVREQNWTAVGIDFTIVVVGVFIGIQVSNWNDSRSDRAQERLLLQRLHADFVALAAESDQKITQLEESLAAVSQLTQHVRAFPSDADAATYSQLIDRVFTVPSSADLSGTYAEIVSSGSMHLISNEALRAELVEHAAKTREHQLSQESRRAFVRPYVAPLFRLGVLVDELTLDEAFASAGGRNQLLVATRAGAAIHEGELQSFQDFKASVLAMTDRLEAEMGVP